MTKVVFWAFTTFREGIHPFFFTHLFWIWTIQTRETTSICRRCNIPDNKSGESMRDQSKRWEHLVSKDQSGSRCPLPQLSKCEHQPRNIVAPDSTSGVYSLVIAHVIPYWVCGRTLRVRSLSMRLCNPHFGRWRRHHYHVASISIWPFFINKNLLKSITRLVRSILNHPNQLKWASFSCVTIFISPRPAPPVSHWG